MRSTQFIGLNEEAIEFLVINAITTKVECCIAEKIPLFSSRLQNDQIAKEVKQRTILSSGPVIFTCLEVDGQRLFEWTEEEMEQHI